MDDHLWSSQLTKCRRVVDCWSADDHWLCYQTTEFFNFALKTFSDIHFLWKNKARILFVISFLFCLVVTKYGVVTVLSRRMPPPSWNRQLPGLWEESGTVITNYLKMAVSLLQAKHRVLNTVCIVRELNTQWLNCCFLNLAVHPVC